jgi:arylsulfatase A-like enzyme
MGRSAYLALIGVILLSFSCKKEISTEKPNVILIMADDMGYECLGSYGTALYKTPVLDALAFGGIRFSNCISQPLCTPSRVKLMTGLFNYRNYDYFGHLNSEEYTFGNLMSEAGYTTCIAGKWQLNGLAYKDSISDWSDNQRPYNFGFDEYCLWQLTKERKEGGRYAHPLIEQNGKLLKRNEEAYGPDIFSNFILDFIERKKDEPFFIYYPMVLVHDPFVPTPDSNDWIHKEKRFKNDTSYFKDMVNYTDKIVGKIMGKLTDLNIAENTIVIFTGDNGTHPSIYTQMANDVIQGGKGNTIDAGTHVPLIVYWPKKIKKGFIYNDLIEFSDFFPTLADIIEKEVISDGKSFYPVLKNDEFFPRKTAFVHYDPKWSNRVNQYRNQFIRTVDYKLYRDGKFFNLHNDILETNPLDLDSLSTDELGVKTDLEILLKNHPGLSD